MYGLIISSGILVSLLLAERLAKKRNLNLDIFWGSSLWMITGGVVGARIYHVVEYWNLYAQNPAAMLFIHKGGLGIYGAILGGALSLIVYSKFKKVKILEFLDLSAVVIPLGQAIGRWGNFVNMEIIGAPTRLPWGMYVPPKNRPSYYRYNDVFHPVFLYESLLDILLFFGLFLLYQRKIMQEKSSGDSKLLYSAKGFFTLAYLTGDGLIRFSTEFVRLESWIVNDINVAQIISLLIASLSITGLFVLVRKFKTFILLASINGFLVSFYLAYKKIFNSALLCGNYGGCDIVQNSTYSTLFGIPLGIWGMVYYLVVFGVFYFHKGKYNNLAKKIILIWGLLFSTMLTLIEAFVIKAFCVWCLSIFLNIILMNYVFFRYKTNRG